MKSGIDSLGTLETVTLQIKTSDSLMCVCVCVYYSIVICTESDTRTYERACYNQYLLKTWTYSKILDLFYEIPFVYIPLADRVFS